MRRRLSIILVTIGLVAACGGGATPTPVPSSEATPAPTDIFVETPAPTEAGAPTETPTTTAPASGERYKVKKGDTLWAIAQKYGVTLEALQAANPGIDPKKMAIGTILVIPAH